MAFFGKLFTTIVIVLSGTIATTIVLIWMIFYILEATDSSQSLIIDWVIVGASLCFGVLVGLGISRCKRVAISIIGAAGGCCFGVIIMTSAMVASVPIYFGVIGGCTLVAGIIAFFF